MIVIILFFISQPLYLFLTHFYYHFTFSE